MAALSLSASLTQKFGQCKLHGVRMAGVVGGVSSTQRLRVQPAVPLLSGDRACVLSPLQTKDAIFTLSAMTSGIRRNWIEALRKNVRPISAPDVTK